MKLNELCIAVHKITPYDTLELINYKIPGYLSRQVVKPSISKEIKKGGRGRKTDFFATH